MNAWLTALAWLFLYWSTLWVVPKKKLCKGLFTRHVLKRIPPKRWWKEPDNGHFYRYMLWLGVFELLYFLHVFPKKSDNIQAAMLWGGLILMLLDDLFFGDDEWWKKLWEGGKNKVKWLMDLPPEPARAPTTR